jgi:SAM-dependent methyltransferase
LSYTPRAAPSVQFECSACGSSVPVALDWDDTPTCTACGRVYRCSGGILQLTEAAHRDDYRDDISTVLAGVEPRHFWFSERNRTILSTMREMLRPLAGLRALDIGCGTGYVTASLESAGMDTCGLDMDLGALQFARQRIRGPLVCQDAAYVPFSGQFDVALMCDVIEHVADDIAILVQARRAVKSDGVLVVTVPAHQVLWTAVDDASGHKRRYSEAVLRDALVRAGWRPRIVRHFNTLLFVVQMIDRHLMSRLAGSGEVDHQRLLRSALRVPPPPINRLLGLAARADRFLGPLLSLRMGTSLIAIADRQPG